MKFVSLFLQLTLTFTILNLSFSSKFTLKNFDNLLRDILISNNFTLYLTLQKGIVSNLGSYNFQDITKCSAYYFKIHKKIPNKSRVLTESQIFKGEKHLTHNSTNLCKT